jgi:Ca2+-binding RTX toxin-like protein
MIVSDDFAAASLGSMWTIAGASGVSVGVGSDGTDGYLQLRTPDGNYDAWGTITGANAMQAAPNTDFQLKTRFLTVPTQQYQMQGFLVKQDAQNWLRFDTYFDGSVLRAFAAVNLAGNPAALISVAIPGNTAPYLRLTRTGNVWKFEYSQDGTTWTTAGSFTQVLTVTAVGLFSGNTGPTVGYTARVDYFENTASPIANEDGTIVPINTIDVWYGLAQTFGTPGEAQKWINILGNAGGHVASLSYSLNGGLAHTLSIGPDTRRLQNPGDFNVDIPYSSLDGSSKDDVVTITEVMDSGATFSRDVVIHYQSGHAWSPNYSIHWQNVTNIQDVAQIVDGTWEIDSNGVRPVDLGYDRLIAIGDRSWDNYQLNFSLTAHDLHNVDPRGRDGGGFAIGMLWNGHTDDPISGWQPKSGWTPNASFFYADDNGDGIGELTLHASDSFEDVIASTSYTLEEGFTYDFRVTVEQVGLYDRLYSLKVWQDGTAEPAGWTLQGTEHFAVSQAPATGSIYFDAHYFDVSFNDMTVSEIPGRDIVQGTSGNDTLIAPYSGNSDEIDVLAGYGGADLFFLGDASGDHYAAAGNADYGFIWDFQSGVDKIQLGGTVADYVLATDVTGLPTGTAIFQATAGGAPGELIGVLNGVRNLSLASSDFVFLGGGVTITGGAGNDTLNGGPGNDTLNGLAGNDTLNGRAGNDTLNGGDGNDKLDGGTGADVMVGGTGNDIYYVDNAGDQVNETAGQGTDTVNARVSWTMAAGQEIETLKANGAGATSGVTFTGNAFNNYLLGGAGSDTLNGGDGNDKLDGGAGADTMYGGTGNDSYYVDNAGDQVNETAGQGTDTVNARVSWTMTAGQEIENLKATGAGASAGVHLTGNGFNNALTGGSGNDTLDGGLGNDRLSGGSGGDFFLFDSALGATNVDTIVSFAAGDTIALAHTIFSGLIVGLLQASQFDLDSAKQSGPEIVYNHTTKAVFFDSNGSDPGGATQFATISGTSLSINNTAFQVV